MATITDSNETKETKLFPAFHAYEVGGILLPNMVHRFMLSEIVGLDEKFVEAIRRQTVSVEIRDDRKKRRSILKWVIEDDVGGYAAEAIENFNSAHSLILHNVNGDYKYNSILEFPGVEVLAVDYLFDYAVSETCKFVLTVSSGLPIRSWPRKPETAD